MFANTGPFVEPDAAVELAQAAEASGCESIWTVEHVVVPAGYESQYPYAKDGKMPGGSEDFDIPDPLIWLSYIAAATNQIRLVISQDLKPFDEANFTHIPEGMKPEELEQTIPSSPPTF